MNTFNENLVTCVSTAKMFPNAPGENVQSSIRILFKDICNGPRQLTRVKSVLVLPEKFANDFPIVKEIYNKSPKLRPEITPVSSLKKIPLRVITISATSVIQVIVT